jgi:protein phosphatase
MTVEQVFDRYYVCGKTDCGAKRDHNEDNILINRQAALIMVADGMGGHLYGDRASFEAINLVDQLVGKYLPTVDEAKSTLSVWEKLVRFFTRTIDADASLEFQAQVIADILIEANSVLFQHNQTERRFNTSLD